MEKELLEKILAILEAQDAKIKSLEAQIEAMGGGVDTLIDTLHFDKDTERFNAFAEKHKAKFDPYLGVMNRLEGGDAFRAIYEKANELDDQEGYDEEAYINEMLAGIIETINSLKEVAPPEAQEALETAEAAIVEAAAETQEGELFVDQGELKDPTTDEWSEEALEKERLEGRQMFR